MVQLSHAWLDSFPHSWGLNWRVTAWIFRGLSGPTPAGNQRDASCACFPCNKCLCIGPSRTNTLVRDITSLSHLRRTPQVCPRPISSTTSRPFEQWLVGIDAQIVHRYESTSTTLTPSSLSLASASWGNPHTISPLSESQGQLPPSSSGWGSPESVIRQWLVAWLDLSWLLFLM